MSVLGSLSIKLGIVTQGFDTSINNSKSKINDLNSAVNTVNKTLSMFGVSLGMATAVQGIRTVMNFADEVDDLGKAFDLSTAKVLQFRDALGQSGGKAENAERILGALFDKIETAKNSMVTDDVAKQFAKLGLSIQDLKTMQPEQALTAVFNGLSKIGNTYERVALIKDILGKGGLGLDIKQLALLMDESSAKFDKNAAALQKVADAADRLERAKEKTKIFFGGVFGDLLEGLDKANAYLDNHPKLAFVLEQLTKSAGLVGRGIVAGMEAFKTVTPSAAPTMPTSAMFMPGQSLGNIKPIGGQGQFGLMGGDLLNKPSIYTAPKAPEIKLGVAAKDLKEAQVDLEQVIASAERRGALNIDQLLASKSATTEIKSQLALEKERIQLRSDAYSLSEKEQKIAELELNRKEQVNHLQKELNDLKLSSDDPMNVKAKEEQLNAQINMINELADAEKNLATVEEERRQSFEFGWKSAFMAYAEDAKNASQVGGDVFNSVVGNMGSALDNFVQTGKFSFKDFANSVIQDILRIMMRWQMMQIITGIMGSFGGSGMGGKFLGSDLPGLSNVAVKTGLPLHASGGYADRPSIVGENGKELFIPNVPGTIIPNARLTDFSNHLLDQPKPEMAQTKKADNLPVNIMPNLELPKLKALPIDLIPNLELPKLKPLPINIMPNLELPKLKALPIDLIPNLELPKLKPLPIELQPNLELPKLEDLPINIKPTLNVIDFNAAKNKLENIQIPQRQELQIAEQMKNKTKNEMQPQMVVNGTYIANMQAIDTQSAQQFLAKNRTAVFAANQSAMRGLPAGR